MSASSWERSLACRARSPSTNSRLSELVGRDSVEPESDPSTSGSTESRPTNGTLRAAKSPVIWTCARAGECETVAAPAGVAELADALDSKSSTRKSVWVRTPPPVVDSNRTPLKRSSQTRRNGGRDPGGSIARAHGRVPDACHGEHADARRTLRSPPRKTPRDSWRRRYRAPSNFPLHRQLAEP